MAGLVFLVTSFSCNKREDPVTVPEQGYAWPDNNRSYWPTTGWRTADPISRGLTVEGLDAARDFAANDPLARGLLVVKDGYLVLEEYFGEGGRSESTNLWSVTKSFSSAAVGLLIADGIVASPDQRMAELLPAYPEFGDITLKHVLTHTTGLYWDEEGPNWVDWIFSEDWVAAALARGQQREPGSRFKYSSGNSHFLTALAHYRTGRSVDAMLDERLFEPMGIAFDTLEEPITYTSWDQYREPLYQTWRRDPQGIACASFGLYLTARDMAKFGFLYLNRGRWEGRQLIPEQWVLDSTRDHVRNIYGRYSYGYQWYLTYLDGRLAFLASGFGGQIIGVVPSLDMVVVLKYEAEDPVHPQSGSAHDDMRLFELVVRSAR